MFCVVNFVAAAILLERNLSLDLNPKVIFFMLLGLSAIDECFDLLVGVSLVVANTIIVYIYIYPFASHNRMLRAKSWTSHV